MAVTRNSPPAAGTLFDLNGVDLFLFNADLGSYTIDGFRNGALQFEATSALFGSGGFSTFGTGYGGFTLDKLTIELSAPFGGVFSLDNIQVNAVDAVSGSTPEPGRLAPSRHGPRRYHRHAPTPSRPSCTRQSGVTGSIDPSYVLAWSACPMNG